MSSLVRVYPNVVLQISKAAGWDYYLSAAGRNSADQDLCAGYCKPFLFLILDSQWLSPADSPVGCWGKARVGLPQSTHNAWGLHNAWELVVPWVFFPVEGPEAPGRPPHRVLQWPGGRRCDQHVATSTLLMQSVLVSVVRGAYTSPLF